MANFVCLLQFTDQGVRNIKDTTKRADAATAEAEKNGRKNHAGILDDGRL